MTKTTLWLAVLLLVPAGAFALAGEEPAAPAAPAPAVDPDVQAMNQNVDELMKEAEAVRGLKYKTPFARKLFTAAQLKTLSLKMIEEETPPEKLKRLSALYARLGFFPTTTDLGHAYSDFLSAGAAGFYDPKTKTLQILRGFSPVGSRPVILHELIHALEDQYFDLSALEEKVALQTDPGLALAGVVEGSAMNFMMVYIQRHPATAMKMIADMMKQQAEQEALLARMPVILSAQVGLFPYMNGMNFIKAVTGGEPEKVSALYSDLPVSTEQILHPEKYGPHGDYPHRVSLPDLSKVLPKGWKVEESDTIGEASIGILLNEFQGGDNQAKLARIQGGMFNPGLAFTGSTQTASEGWDGDRIAGCFGPDGQVAYVWASCWDTPKDATEFAAAFEAGLPYKWKTLGLTPGTSHIEVRGARVLIVEGFPAGAMDAIAAAAFDGAAFVPDPRDAADVAKLEERVREEAGADDPR